jgi:co-chaperonin GroES (HSP10)
MSNKSGLKPLGRAVLVQPYEPEIKKSMIVMPETVKERTTMVETRAVVIEIGPVAWDDEPQPRAKPGDKVLISKFAGAMAKGPLDGQMYRLVNDRDLYCGIEEE